MKQMKKIVWLAMAIVASFTIFSCGGEDDVTPSEKEPETPVRPETSVDKDYIPSTSTIQTSWYGQYTGWDAVQGKNTTIGRTLVLNANGTYTNTIQGKLDGQDDLIDFESEKGTYSYNSSTGIISYTVQYDKLINYQTLKMTEYTKKHYYSADGNNSDDKAIYTEKAQFTSVQNGSRQWVAKDTYLQQLTAETLELYFLMENTKKTDGQ